LKGDISGSEIRRFRKEVGFKDAKKKGKGVSKGRRKTLRAEKMLLDGKGRFKGRRDLYFEKVFPEEKVKKKKREVLRGGKKKTWSFNS